LTKAADDADFVRTTALEHGNYSAPIPTEWKDARCRWTDEPNLAKCATRYRMYPAKAWHSGTFRYERGADGIWRWRG
jgi:hypothetical protein